MATGSPRSSAPFTRDPAAAEPSSVRDVTEPELALPIRRTPGRGIALDAVARARKPTLVSAIPALIEEGSTLVHRLAPEGDVISYGHAGDGNLHFNVSQRPDSDIKSFMARGPVLELAMFDLVESLGGSISAEHGIGRLKAAEFARRADPVELAVMHELKRALDCLLYTSDAADE